MGPVTRSILPSRVVLVAAAVCGLALGCESASPVDLVTPEGTIVQTRLTAVHSLYRKFRADKGRSPRDLEEINDFGRNLPVERGGPLVLTAAFLRSPRDKSPLVIRFGLQFSDESADDARPESLTADSTTSPGTADDGPVLAYESEGFEGRRFVIFAVSGRIEQLDDVDVIQQAM